MYKYISGDSIVQPRTVSEYMQARRQETLNLEP